MKSKRVGIAAAAAVVLSVIGVTAAIAASSGRSSTSSGSPTYGWMMGGSSAPQWMMGGSLPTSMMGATRDPGTVMGAALANASGPRVNSVNANHLGAQVPVDVVIDGATGRITFDGLEANLSVLASPKGGPDETFRIAGMVNPTLMVPRGARVTIQIVNADADTAHGLVITRPRAASVWMPMMLATPAFSGAAVWVLGNPTAAGMHSQTLTFTATSRGTYQYLCPVPGHAQEGMFGTLLIK
jgi:rusticyanin